MNSTNWVPGLVTFAVSVIGAVLFLLWSRRLQEDTPLGDDVDDLEARYQTRLAELRELIANKHLLPAGAFEEERKRLEQAASDVLRARDERKHEQVKTKARAEKKAAAAPGFASRNSGLVGALVGGSAVAFMMVLGNQLSANSTERGEGMQATGATPPGAGGPREGAPDTKLEALATRVQQHPEDVDVVADLALYLIRRQAFAEARAVVDRAVLLDPFHPRARAGRAVMRAVDGELRASIDDLEQLGRKYPEAYDAHMFAGMLAMEDSDPSRALRNLENYVKLAPADEQPPMMRMVVVQLKQEIAAGRQPAP